MLKNKLTVIISSCALALILTLILMIGGSSQSAIAQTPTPGWFLSADMGSHAYDFGYLHVGDYVLQEWSVEWTAVYTAYGLVTTWDREPSDVGNEGWSPTQIETVTVDGISLPYSINADGTHCHEFPNPDPAACAAVGYSYGGNLSQVITPGLHTFTFYGSAGRGPGGPDLVHFSGALSDVHLIYYGITNTETCGVIQDAHMVLDPPASTWVPFGGATHSGSEWTLPQFGGIRQNTPITPNAAITVFVTARYDILPGTLTIGAGGSETTIEIDSASYDVFTATLRAAQSYQSSDFTLQNTSGAVNILVDHVCVYVGPCKPGPCGITCADMAYSDRFLISNGGFEDDTVIPIPNISCESYTFSVGAEGDIGLSCGLPPIVEFGMNYPEWNSRMGIIWGSTILDGINRLGYESSRALGLVPSPLHYGIEQITRSDPNLDPVYGQNVGYNVVFRGRAGYGNSLLTVNSSDPNKKILQDMPSEWNDYSVWFPPGSQHSVSFNSSCESLGCSGGVGASAVTVDDIYIVPGPDMQCSRIVSPTMECINPNPDFSMLDQGWETANGASITTNDATLPAGAYIQQYVPGTSGGSTSGLYSALSTGIVAGQSYIMSISAGSAGGNATGSGIVGASQPGSSGVVNLSLSAANPSGVFTGSFTAAANMFNGDNFPIRVLADEGNSTQMHIYSVCIKSGDSPITTTTCLGEWQSSEGGAAIGVTLSPPAYVKNTYDLDGGYFLDMAGTAGEGINTIVGVYVMGTGEQIHMFMTDVSGAFTKTVSFAVNYSGGELRLYAENDIVYSNLCLRGDGTGGKVPKALPFPECPAYVLTMNSLPIVGGNFFIQKPYSITNAYEGQVQPASYIGEMVYNYAIYPYVCTFIHVANKQYQQMAALLALLTVQLLELQLKLDAIIALLAAILAKIPGSLPPTCGLLDLLATVFGLLLQLLLELLKLLFALVRLIIEALTSINADLKSEDSISYPISCAGDNEWICFGLSLIKAADSQFSSTIGVSSVLNIFALMVVAILTFHMIMWGQGQLRGMLQPGTDESDKD